MFTANDLVICLDLSADPSKPSMLEHDEFGMPNLQMNPLWQTLQKLQIDPPSQVSNAE